MKILSLFILGAWAASADPIAAAAASSQWAETDGGGVRLIIESKGSDNRTLRGAIEIDLKPGWKTYWRDPGDAGVPPTIDVGAAKDVASADIHFPAPKRFDDGFSIWAGYKEPVSLPVIFTLTGQAEPTVIEAHVFLGVCQDICIPVDARFSVDLTKGGTANDASIEAAFAALPETATPENALSNVRVDGRTISVAEGEVWAGESPELFAAAPPGWTLSPPKSSGKGFTFDILFKPKSAAISGNVIPYTLVSASKSVSGTFTLP